MILTGVSPQNLNLNSIIQTKVTAPLFTRRICRGKRPTNRLSTTQLHPPPPSSPSFFSIPPLTIYLSVPQFKMKGGGELQDTTHTHLQLRGKDNRKAPSACVWQPEAGLATLLSELLNFSLPSTVRPERRRVTGSGSVTVTIRAVNHTQSTFCFSCPAVTYLGKRSLLLRIRVCNKIVEHAPLSSDWSTRTLT